MSDIPPLTPDQIRNWREALSAMIGPYAFIMPEERIQAIRDNLQQSVNDGEQIEHEGDMEDDGCRSTHSVNQ